MSAPVSKQLELESLFSVRGKYVLVTGGAKGIGQMITEGFARNGAVVLISGRDAAACEALAANVPGVVALPGADLSSAAGPAALAGEVLAALRRLRGAEALDVLVHNSGTTWGQPLPEFQEKGWDRVMATNVKAPFFLTQALAPALARAAQISKSHSSIISIGSVNGIENAPIGTYSYDASKAAIHHLTRHLAFTLSGDNITCNSIAPGLFPSKMSKQLEVYEPADAQVAR